MSLPNQGNILGLLLLQCVNTNFIIVLDLTYMYPPPTHTLFVYPINSFIVLKQSL